MDDHLKREIERRRQALAIKSLWFNRFLFVRYMTALFFFAFFNWALAMYLSRSTLFVVPVLLMLWMCLAAVEQIKMYNRHNEQAPLTHLSFKGLLIAQIVLLIVSVTSMFSLLFPFLMATLTTKSAVVCLVSFGIMINLLVLKKLMTIRTRQDKHYQRLQAMRQYQL